MELRWFGRNEARPPPLSSSSSSSALKFRQSGKAAAGCDVERLMSSGPPPFSLPLDRSHRRHRGKKRGEEGQFESGFGGGGGGGVRGFLILGSTRSTFSLSWSTRLMSEIGGGGGRLDFSLFLSPLSIPSPLPFFSLSFSLFFSLSSLPQSSTVDRPTDRHSKRGLS